MRAEVRYVMRWAQHTTTTPPPPPGMYCHEWSKDAPKTPTPPTPTPHTDLTFDEIADSSFWVFKH